MKYGDEECVLTESEYANVVAQAQESYRKHREWLMMRRGIDPVDPGSATEEWIARAVRWANSSKIFNQSMGAVREIARKRTEDERLAIDAEWTYARYYRLMQERAHDLGDQLVFDEQTKANIMAACFRLSNDPRYETDLGLSFRRGLIIYGDPGLGKTWPWRLIASNPRTPIQFVTMNDVMTSIRETGRYDGIRWQAYPIIMLDDIGIEIGEDGPLKYYGTPVNWFKNFIEDIYSRDKHSLSRLVITTMDNAEVIGQKYGKHVRDRLAEMFDVLVMDGQSFRQRTW